MVELIETDFEAYFLLVMSTYAFAIASVKQLIEPTCFFVMIIFLVSIYLIIVRLTNYRIKRIHSKERGELNKVSYLKNEKANIEKFVDRLFNIMYALIIASVVTAFAGFDTFCKTNLGIWLECNKDSFPLFYKHPYRVIIILCFCGLIYLHVLCEAILKKYEVEIKKFPTVY
ncbi:MAG: hypothetical protein ACLT5V_07705 [Enterococcus avium]